MSDHGVGQTYVYDITLYIMAVLLLCGFICNSFVKPVNEKYCMTDEELAAERALQHERPRRCERRDGRAGQFRNRRRACLARCRLSVLHRPLHRVAAGGRFVLTIVPIRRFIERIGDGPASFTVV